METLREEEELRQEAEDDKVRRIRELEEQLQNANDLAANNNAATGILSGFISKGKAKMQNDGSVTLVQQDDQDNYVDLEPEDLI